MQELIGMLLATNFVDVAANNWQWFLLGFYVMEKVVRLTPWKQDDIIFDMIIIPTVDKFKEVFGMKTGTMKMVLPFFLVFFFLMGGVSQAATRTALVSLDWDGNDVSGAVEGSLPVTITVFDADTHAVLSTADVNGAVTDYAMPAFNIEVPENQTVVLSVYATAKDSVGNESAPSATASVTLQGDDTLSPGVPLIRINLSN